jgi:hypothetical protein
VRVEQVEPLPPAAPTRRPSGDTASRLIVPDSSVTSPRNAPEPRSYRRTRSRGAAGGGEPGRRAPASRCTGTGRRG